MPASERSKVAPNSSTTPAKTRVAAPIGSLSVSVCGFEFVFRDRHEAAIYLTWFENYAKQHRRQREIIAATPSLRNRLAKLPANLFKTQNRPKVIRALRTLIPAGGKSSTNAHARGRASR